MTTDLVLSPAIPSNTTRSGGGIFPILRSTARAYDSEPGQVTARRIGAFLMKSSFQAQIITSAMFMTAMADNPLCVELAEQLGVQISCAGWALAASIPVIDHEEPCRPVLGKGGGYPGECEPGRLQAVKS